MYWDLPLRLRSMPLISIGRRANGRHGGKSQRLVLHVLMLARVSALASGEIVSGQMRPNGVTLELTAPRADGTPPLGQRELQRPLLARSVRRQLLGDTLALGDRRTATLLGRRHELAVAQLSDGAESGRGITVGDETVVQLRAHGAAAVADEPTDWHSEASTAPPMTAAMVEACEATWPKELRELVEVLRMVMAVRGAAQLPLGVSRGVLLQAAAGGGKTTLLRYFLNAASRHAHSRLGRSEHHDDGGGAPAAASAAAADTARAAQAERVSRLSQRQRPAAVCDGLPPLSVLAFSGMDAARTDNDASAAAAGSGDSLTAFLSHANALSQRQQQEQEEDKDREPAALLVWLDDMDVLLATEPGGGGDNDDDSVPADAAAARRQLLAWLSQLPRSSNIVVVGSVSDAAVSAKAVPALVSAGAHQSMAWSLAPLTRTAVESQLQSRTRLLAVPTSAARDLSVCVRCCRSTLAQPRAAATLTSSTAVYHRRDATRTPGPGTASSSGGRACKMGRGADRGVSPRGPRAVVPTCPSPRLRQCRDDALPAARRRQRPATTCSR